MATYYSKSGNPEVWDQKPEGYLTVEEWRELNPLSASSSLETSEDQLPLGIEARLELVENLFIALMKGELNV